VRIGDGASLGAFVMVMDTDFHVAGSKDAAPTPTPIEIGPGARIGNNVVVLRGSVIGAGARVAPGSVVSGVVPAWTEVAGVPARPVVTAAAAGSVEERTIAVVAAVMGSADGLDAGRRLDSLPTWDSLTALNLLLSLESAFGIELAPSEVGAARTIGDLLRVVAEKRT
jgi:acyl carrier protein